MLFNSLTFVIFAAIFFLIWPFVARYRGPRLWLILVASCVFYGWWDWRYLSLVALSGFVDFFAAIWMEKFPARRKPILAVSLGINLLTLGLFKYLTMFLTTFNDIALFANLPVSLSVYHLPLPIGISFYTFQSMSYTIDVYRGNLKATRDPLQFFAFLMFFPQLVAGPIVRAVDLLPKLNTWRKPSEPELWDGIRLISFGFFKKMVIADNLASAVNAAFSDGMGLASSGHWWLATLMFSVQVYTDFSGYSDIARGMLKICGYEVPLNFDHPYWSQSIKEFWNRWHISLSSWFRDYLYFPLGGSRLGTWKTYRNIWITMVVSGLWHGAAWNFVMWGVSQALFLSIERLIDWPKHVARLPGGRFLNWLLTSMQILIGMAIFRSQNLHQVRDVVTSMLSFNFLPVEIKQYFGLMPMRILGIAILLEVANRLLDAKGREKNASWRMLEPVVVSVLAVAAVFFRGPGNAFVYFQF